MNDLFPRDILISIKPKFVELIKSKKKTHEFRKYSPKNDVKHFFIYVTSPVAEIKYIAEVETPVEFPNKINPEGFGNTDFNLGLKKSKFAFPILHLEEIVKGVPLSELRDGFGVYPPQSYIYMDSVPKLSTYLNQLRTKKIY